MLQYNSLIYLTYQEQNKMIKKIALLGILALLTFTHAKILDALALVVNGEPVTTAEIAAVQKQMNISKKQAIDLLIQDRLQKSAMKNIFIDENIIDQKISGIAAQNHLKVPQMQKILLSQGTKWNQYRNSIRESLKKEKFFQENVANNIPTPNEDELKLYYQQHVEAFILPKSIHLVEYTAKTAKAMKRFLQTNNKKGIRSRKVTKKTKDLASTMLSTLMQTKDGFVTRPFNAGDKYISYKVLSKVGKVTMPYETSKNAVLARWRQEQQGVAVKDYFKKLATNADIRRIR